MSDPDDDERRTSADDATVIADDATALTGGTGEGAAGSTGRRSTAVATDHTELEQYGPADDSLRAGGRRRIIKERFVLDERLGKGGMGQVYRALDLRKQEAEDDRPYVAIKFLGEAFSRHPKALISLQREAKKTQELAHPNIVTVYDFDRDGTHVYMTMELLDGAPLSNWDALTFEDGHGPGVESMIIQLAEGLAYAHSKGFVHSDLKPDNVFITRDGRIKILDFGIARIADAAAQQDAFDAGSLGALTTRYASLEMLERTAEPHPADDIYALGIIAYQLYSGEHPFGGASAREAHEQGLQPGHLKGLSGFRQRAIERALQLRRENRTASAEDFLASFTGARRRRRFLVAGIAALLISSIFFAYLSTREAGPSVPFSELPASVQAQLTQKIEAGRQSLAIGDWDGASRYFMESWELHPRNPDIKAGLDRIVEQLESRVQGAGSQRERELLLRFLDAYAEHPYFSESERFRELHDELATALE